MVSMVARLTLKRPEHEKDWPVVKQLLAESDKLQRLLLTLVDRDSESFSALMNTYRLPKENEQEKKARSEEIQSKLKQACQVPLETAEKAGDVLAVARKLANSANLNALSDLQTALSLAEAGLVGAAANVEINLASIKDQQFRRQVEEKLHSIKKTAEKDRSEGFELLESRSKLM